MLIDYADQRSRKGPQAWQVTSNGYRSADWWELGQLGRNVLLLAGFLLPLLVPGAGSLAAAFLAPLTRYLHVAACGLGLFSVAAHKAESESARKQGRYGNDFHHPVWKVSLCHCY